MAEGKRRPAPQFLRIRRIPHARLVARPVLEERALGAGIVQCDDSQVVVQGSGLRRMGREQIPPPALPVAEPIATYDNAVFGGYLHDHFGHFLLESTSRLWLPAVSDDVPIVWIANWTDRLAPWMHEVFDVLGLGPHRVVVTAAGPVEVGELAVADPGFEFGAFMHPWMGHRLHCVDSAPVDGVGNHVWLSRSGLHPTSGLDEDLELDARLRDEGWTVVQPENLTFREQMTTLAGATHIAGVEGSAFHSLALLRSFTGVVDLFTRQEHVNFELVAEACGFTQHRHQLPGASSRERREDRKIDAQWSGLDIDATIRLLRSTCLSHGHQPVG